MTRCDGWQGPDACTWKAAKTIEIRGLAILQLCPECLRNLEQDEYLGGNDSFFEVDEKGDSID